MRCNNTVPLLNAVKILTMQSVEYFEILPVFHLTAGLP